MNSIRRPLIAGNWKLFHGGLSATPLAQAVVAISRELDAVDLVLCPPFTALPLVAIACHNSRVQVGGQNLYPKDQGAFTGEVSAPMLRDVGCKWVIVGHSERRQLFGETDVGVREKTVAALAGGLIPIVCVGETLAEREAGKTLQVVERQVRAFLDVLAGHSVAIAYEPVWAIGTGKNAGPAEAEEVHAAIRSWLGDLADRTRILYGGSVKPDNAAALLGCANVDGGLVGGASLDAASFGGIARAAQG